jgi:hypothetical protein
MNEAIKTQAETWAALTVARYAQSAEPELSSAEREKLQDDLVPRHRDFDGLIDGART